MAIYGYCRVSRPKQNIERQVRNILAAYPAATIVKEIYTRTTFEGRKKWDKLVKQVVAGDTIVFDSVSRMSGSTEEGVACYKDLFAKGIELVFLNEPHINTATYKNALTQQIAMTGTTADIIIEAVNRFLLTIAEEQIKLAFQQSEKEVEDLRTRTKGGIQTARLNGKTIGRPAGRTYETKKAVKAKQDILKMAIDFGGTMNDKDCIRLLGISPNTYYKYKRELLEQRAAEEIDAMDPKRMELA